MIKKINLLQFSHRFSNNEAKVYYVNAPSNTKPYDVKEVLRSTADQLAGKIGVHAWVTPYFDGQLVIVPMQKKFDYYL